MKAHIVQIGNSQGIRLPKVLLEECGFDKDTIVDITAKKHQLIIKPYKDKKPRAGWAEAMQKMAKNGEDTLLEIGNIENDWDKEEWQW